MIPHSRPTITKNDIASVASNLLSGRIASGAEVGMFEKEMSGFIGVRGGVATNSGTCALHLALNALNIKRGDEVMLPTYVCASVLSAVNYTGATPVLADIEPEGYNIDPESAEKRLSKKTKAIIAPHMFGIPANLKQLMALGVPVIEDCAQSAGAECEGKGKKAKAGSFGDLSIFSFYATKVMTTGHGGMVLSDSAELIGRICDMTKYDERESYKTSYNYGMTDFQAALGRSQLKQLDGFIARRKEIADSYDDAFESLGIPARKNREGICFRYVIELDNPDAFIREMNARGISCAKPVFRPLHRYFEAMPKIIPREFPNAERAMSRAVSVPVYPLLTDAELTQVIEAIRAVFAEGRSAPIAAVQQATSQNV